MWFFLLPFAYILIRMFSFSSSTESALAQLQPLFALRVRLWLLLVKAFHGLDVVIVSGKRTFAEQAALHAADRRNPAPSVNNPDSHMAGLAVDVNFFRGSVNALHKSSTPMQWQAVVSLARLCGLRWGGNFTNYYDSNHFDGL